MKIAINGAGIAGPSLAHWLLRAGHEPVIYERAPHFRAGGYMIDFWGGGYGVAERMGILPGVRERGYLIDEVRFVNSHGRRVGGFPVRVFQRMTGNRFISLPRGDLAEIIYRSIEGRVETVFGDSIAAIEEHEGGVRVGFERAPARDFDLVVGADGLHSRVRELAFGAEDRFERHLGYHVAVFTVTGYRPRDELVYFGHSVPGRQVARFSERGDRTTFLFIFRSELMRAPEPRDDDARRRVLREVFAGVGWECPRALGAMDHAKELYFDRVSQIRMDRWSNGRVVLVGDAGACVSLLAGEGTGLAMIESYILAGELGRAGGDFREAFRRYEAHLRSFIETKQESASRFAGAFAPRTRAGVWFRNLASRLLVIPGVAGFYAGRSLRDDVELPEYGFAAPSHA